MFHHFAFKGIVIRGSLALAAFLSWCAASQAQSWPQPVPGAQRAVVKYREGLFGRVRYKSRYGNGISDNGVMFFNDLFNTAGTLLPVILKQPAAGSGTDSGGGSGDGSGIPDTSGGEGRNAVLEAQEDADALKKMQDLRQEFQTLLEELSPPAGGSTDPPPRVAPTPDENAALGTELPRPY